MPLQEIWIFGLKMMIYKIEELLRINRGVDDENVRNLCNALGELVDELGLLQTEYDLLKIKSTHTDRK